MIVNAPRLALIIALAMVCTSSYAQLVSNPSELNAAIASAGPGTTILLQDGTWDDVFIEVDRNGTVNAPITVRAQNPGAVFMTGNSRVYLSGDYLTVAGLVFQNPSNLVISGGNIERSLN